MIYETLFNMNTDVPLSRPCEGVEVVEPEQVEKAPKRRANPEKKRQRKLQEQARRKQRSQQPKPRKRGKR